MRPRRIELSGTCTGVDRTRWQLPAGHRCVWSHGRITAESSMPGSATRADVRPGSDRSESGRGTPPGPAVAVAAAAVRLTNGLPGADRSGRRGHDGAHHRSIAVA